MKSLNQAQKQAVEYNQGPLLIVAGAGTGKTTVITEKIAYLVKNNLAKPEEILALTFTDKAAAEMLERVDVLLDVGYIDMQISTFHAFAQRILEKYGLEIGVPNQFRLLTETDAWLLFRENFDKFKLDYYRPLGNPTRHIHELIKHFQKCKDELISPEEYLKYAESVKLDSGDANTDERSRLTELANAYHTYNQVLLDNNAFDFADLIYYANKLIGDRERAKKGLQSQFKYILVDEFQDVNWSQYKLVQSLAGGVGNLTAVGDDDQSIYAFRGASVSNILRFKDDYPKAKEIVLNENYRSGQEILDLAYRSIQNNNPDRLEEKLKIDKKLKAKTEKLVAKVIHVHKQSLDEEVRTVVEEIQNLKLEIQNLQWDDIAILVRANNHAAPFLQALESAGVPYEFLASSGLFRQKVVLDCINFFKLLDNYHESTAVYRLLRMPFLGFSESDMHKLTGMAKRKSVSYYEALKRAREFGLSAEGVNICDKLVSIIHEGMKNAKSDKPTAVLYNFLEGIGYFSYLTKEESGNKRDVIRQIFHLKQFFEFINSYEEVVPGANVVGFMQQYQYINDSGDSGNLYQSVDTPDSVNVMTVHASKGLEFRYVFVVNMVEERFPTRRMGDGIEIPVELIKESLPSGDAHYQEERRLFYVAVTRAKEKLYLTSSSDYGGVREKKISRFLDEVGFKIIKSSSAIMDKKSSFPIYSDMKSEEDIYNFDFQYQLPKSFSFSQIRSYETCPYQYKLAHILKIPMKGNASFSFGSTMHNTLQKFYEKVQELNNVSQGSLFGTVEPSHEKSNIKVPSMEDLLEIYEKSWIDDWYSNKRQREDYYKKGKEILKTFYKTHDGEWTVPVSLEGGFKIKVGKYLLNGRIDRVDQLEDRSLEIIDYKTGQSKEKLIGEDKDQLLIYQMVTQTLPQYRNIGETSKLTFYYLNDNIKTSFYGKDKDLEKLGEKIEKTIDRIHEGDFTAKPNKMICGRCDFRDICEFRA